MNITDLFEAVGISLAEFGPGCGWESHSTSGSRPLEVVDSYEVHIVQEHCASATLAGTGGIGGLIENIKRVSGETNNVLY